MMQIQTLQALISFHPQMLFWFPNHWLVQKIISVDQGQCFYLLSGRNKFGFLDGSIPTPDLSHPLYNVWHKANTTILSWMVNSLSKDLATSVMYIHTVRDLWIDMRDRFSQPNVPRFFENQKEISKLSQGSLSVSSYFTKFNILWDELVHYQSFTACTCACTCGSQRNQLNA